MKQLLITTFLFTSAVVYFIVTNAGSEERQPILYWFTIILYIIFISAVCCEVWLTIKKRKEKLADINNNGVVVCFKISTQEYFMYHNITHTEAVLIAAHLNSTYHKQCIYWAVTKNTEVTK